MSQDYQLAWPCPHLTVEEVVALDPEDRRSLDTRQPVAGAGTVQILVNDDTLVPSTGLKSFASLYSTLSGPFDLTENETTLTIETSTGSFTTTLNVRGVERWSTDKVVKQFLTAGFSIGVVENINGHIAISDTNTVGVDSKVRVSGSLAAALGFGDPAKNGWQYQARGKDIYPGWKLVIRPDEIVNRFPQFLEPVVGNPTFKVTYTVPVNRCLRCQATHIENDIRFAPDGNPILVDNEDLLYQAALKVLLTDRGSNPFHPWYGTTIRERIGSKALGNVAASISDDVRRALENFVSVQKDQAEYQVVTPRERLYRLLSVVTRPHEEDPTTFLVDVEVQNAASQPISLSIVYTVPEVVALMGSNGLYLGTQAAGVTPGQASDLFRT
jgi:hypothetical protein